MLTKTNVLYDNIWAIDESELLEIITFYNSFQTGKDLNTSGFKTELFPGKPIFQDRIKDTAILRIDGKLVFYQDPFLTMISSTSVNNVMETLAGFLKMEAVSQIVLEINSPGGNLSPALMLSEFIFSCRSIKPIIGIISNECLSGGYLIGAACDKLYVASPASRVGGIGTLTTVSTKPDEIKKSYDIITGAIGRFKDTNSTQKEIQEYKEATLNRAYEITIEAASCYRNLSPETFKNTEGKIFYGDEAVKLCLVDGYYDLKEWVLNTKIITKGEN